jgi:protoheme IX farnesyltransferase
LFIALLLILLGLLTLTSAAHNASALLLLGVFAVFWYNALYTYLKRFTAFAAVPGALIGAIPPLIGYSAAGGRLGDPLILLVAIFFFIWQIPHFWLLMLMMGDQYRDAGLPAITAKFARPQLARITFTWMLATAAGGLAFPTLRHIGIALPWSLVLVVASFWLAAKGTGLLHENLVDDSTVMRKAFRQINAYGVMVMACLSLSALGV